MNSQTRIISLHWLGVRLISREGHREQANAEDTFNLPDLGLSTRGSEANNSHSIHGRRDSKVSYNYHCVVECYLRFKTGCHEPSCRTGRASGWWNFELNILETLGN